MHARLLATLLELELELELEPGRSEATNDIPGDCGCAVLHRLPGRSDAGNPVRPSAA
jgi:hypothetical protein